MKLIYFLILFAKLGFIQFFSHMVKRGVIVKTSRITFTGRILIVENSYHISVPEVSHIRWNLYLKFLNGWNLDNFWEQLFEILRER